MRLRRIAREFGCWLHVDACWGGAVALSAQHRHLLRGAEQADSLAWNPHKMVGMPLQSSVLLVRLPATNGLAGGARPPANSILQTSNGATATKRRFPTGRIVQWGHAIFEFGACIGPELGEGYLFHGNPYDVGDKTLQCGRRPDVVKIYLSLKYHGLAAYERRVDTAMANAAAFVALLQRRRDEFELAHRPSFVNVCFWCVHGRRDGRGRQAGLTSARGTCAGRMRRYVPAELRTTAAYAARRDEVLARLTVAVHAALLREGQTLVSTRVRLASTCRMQCLIVSPSRCPVLPSPPQIDHSPYGSTHYFRIAISAPTVTADHLERCLDDIARAGARLWRGIVASIG